MTKTDSQPPGGVGSRATLDPEERLDRAALQRHQLARLRAMLDPVLRHNAFYRDKLGRAGLEAAGDLTGMDACRRLPFTTKDELTDDQARTPPYGSLATFPLERYVREHHTTGTTGRPLRWLDTAGSWEWLGRCWARVYRAAAVTSADRVFFPFSFGPYLGIWSGVEGARQLGCLILPGGGMTSLERVRTIVDDRVTVIVSTPTYALRLAEVAAGEGVDLAASMVRVNIVAGEPGAGLPATRTRLQEAFGSRVFDHAGATEVGAWGFECEARDGLHINESEFIFEVVDPQTGAPAREGELVATNLGRAGMPLIRYRTGDHGRLCAGPCACGSTYRRLEGGVTGRLDQRLTVRGVEFYPSEIENVVGGFREVAEFAVDVYRRGRRDVVDVRVEVGGGGTEEVVSGLARSLRSALGVPMDVRAVPVGTLPRFPVKAQRVTDRRRAE